MSGSHHISQQVTSVLAASPGADCQSSNWAKQWQCGWHEPTAGAAAAGWHAGPPLAAALLVLLVFVLIYSAVRRSGQRRSGQRAGVPSGVRARS